MNTFKKKSNLKYIAHNPTGELVWALQKAWRAKKIKNGGKNKKTGGKTSK